MEQACRAGVRAVQVREKDLSAQALYTLAEALRAVTQRYQARLFINDRVDIALAVGADGVHCRETSLPPGVVRRIAPGLLLGASVHAEDTARRAAQQGADFVLFGPVFDTPSKQPYGPPQGLDALESLARKIDIPVFAVGGLNPARAARCLQGGAYGVAAVSSIIQADDVTAAVQAYAIHNVIP